MCIYEKCDFIIIDIDFFYGRCGRYNCQIIFN